MPKITVDAESANAATAMTVVPKDYYPGFVHSQRLDLSQKTGAPMICLKMQIDGPGLLEHDTAGDYRGRILPSTHEKMWFRVMCGGKKEDGELHNLGRFYDLVNALNAVWICKDCGKSSQAKFAKEKGRYFTPCCGKKPVIDVNTDEWLGLRAMWSVDTRKREGSEIEDNEIKGIRPITS